MTDSSPPPPPGAHPEPPDHLTPFQQHVVEVVAGLGHGEVLTYAEVAMEAEGVTVDDDRHVHS